MQLSLGIDTGGTYTDAVLFDQVDGVIAKAKSLTTRHDLAIGISRAIGAVIAAARIETAKIGLVSLSTTLATNALVEGRGGRVALLFIGFTDADAQRAGLTEALDGDPLVHIGGGHDSHGSPIAELDETALERAAVELAPEVSAFAVTAQFATRNPEHETRAREVLLRLTNRPVTSGHELSAKLNGPRRALTSVLNARLIGLITSLIESARVTMADLGIDAPLMVVRGDGSLMAAELAVSRPIETIVSGPAASLIGAVHLAGVADAVVADIGGTTTDIAILRDGVPRLDPDGARVGGFHTMVEAVAMTTIGLGGDSEVIIDVRHPHPAVVLGPRRVVPVSLVAIDHPTLVHDALDRQLRNDLPSDHDGRFLVPMPIDAGNAVGLSADESALHARIGDVVRPMGGLVRTLADGRRLRRLIGRGLVQVAAFTPTDASHVLGEFTAFDADAARKAATLMSRTRSFGGVAVAPDAETLAGRVVDTLRRRSAEALLDVGLALDGFAGSHLSGHPLVAASLDRRVGIVAVSAGLAVPVIGLGASAGLVSQSVLSPPSPMPSTPADPALAAPLEAPPRPLISPAAARRQSADPVLTRCATSASLVDCS